MENWLLYLDSAHSPFWNMAMDELLLISSDIINKPILRFYEWDRPSISIGYIQKYKETAKDGYSVVRRPTGGGVVFHDVDLTYTVVIPSKHWISKLGREESYYLFHQIVIDALNTIGVKSDIKKETLVIKERSNMQCFTAPVKFDVVSDNGSSKIAGAAQRRTKNGILHQGSIVLNDIKNNKNRIVNNIILTLEKKYNILFNEFAPDAELVINIESLIREKYNTEKWNKLR